MDRQLRALISVVGGVVAASSGLADILTYSASIPTHTTNFTQIVSLAQFDHALGALQSVTVTANVGYTGKHFGENLSASSGATFLSRLTYSVTLTGPDAGVVANMSDVNERAGALAASDGALDFGGASGYTTYFNDARSSVTSLLTDADMALFVGTGTVAYTFHASATSFLHASGGSVTMGVGSQAFGTLRIEYVYAPIPTPGAAIPLGAMAALAAVRRRR